MCFTKIQYIPFYNNSRIMVHINLIKPRKFWYKKNSYKIATLLDDDIFLWLCWLQLDLFSSEVAYKKNSGFSTSAMIHGWTISKLLIFNSDRNIFFWKKNNFFRISWSIGSYWLLQFCKNWMPIGKKQQIDQLVRILL